ncbi:MAG: sulfatase, partial [Verrucomicrobiae bacterium]|nr:sulfatase [Verrucomicrobiae bacterium]
MRRFGTAWAVCISFAVAWSARIAEAQVERPNILFIVVDDLNTTIGCYGGDILSPNIDALATRGLLFERAYCQEAVCAPSRISVLSGLRPDVKAERIGRGSGGGNKLRSTRPGTVTLPELFQKNGYHTVSLGKVFHHSEVETAGPIAAKMPRDELSWSERAWFHGTPYQQWFEPRSFELVAEMEKLPEDVRPSIVRGPPYEWSNQPDDVYADGQIANQAVQTLRRIKDRPFFLAIGFRRPHLPFNCPQKYWDLYPADQVHLPENFYPPRDVPEVALHNAYELRSYADIAERGPLPERHLKNLVRGYKAAASYMDAQLGKVLSELDRLGLRKNTIVILWSDHGYHTGENSMWTKMTNFEIATRVPLIVSLPSGL